MKKNNFLIYKNFLRIYFPLLKDPFIWKDSIISQINLFFKLKKIKLSGHPSELPPKYQNPKLYKKYNNLKFGEMITFHNLYPHSSHNGPHRHKTVMLQLVFDLA